jgi:hypothetical protein
MRLEEFLSISFRVSEYFLFMQVQEMQGRYQAKNEHFLQKDKF